MTRLTKTETLRILAALIAGFVGGWIRTDNVPVAAAAGKLIQAERIELIDNNGKLLAYLGTGDGQKPILRFLNSKRNEAATLGLTQTDSPFLNMLGTDSKIRLTLRVEGLGDRPILAMSDNKWEGRVMLGFIQSDVPSTSDDDWGLVFRAPQGNTAIADLVMIRDALSGRISGKLALLDKNGKVLVMPK